MSETERNFVIKTDDDMLRFFNRWKSNRCRFCNDFFILFEQLSDSEISNMIFSERSFFVFLCFQIDILVRRDRNNRNIQIFPSGLGYSLMVCRLPWLDNCLHSIVWCVWIDMRKVTNFYCPIKIFVPHLNTWFVFPRQEINRKTICHRLIK